MNMGTSRRLHRSQEHRMIAGVAGGIAEYLGIDPTIVRILWVVAAIVMLPMTGPFMLLLYVVLALVVPQAPAGTA